MAGSVTDDANGDGPPQEPEDARFPTRLLALSLIATVALVGSLSWTAQSTYRLSNSLQQEYLEIEELRGEITYRGEVLTASTRMAAATGEDRWVERYQLHQPQLSSAIDEAHRLAEPLIGADDLQTTREASAALLAMESAVFDLVESGDRAAATELLESRQYEQVKQRYAQGVQRALDRVRGEFDSAMGEEQLTALISVGTVVVTMLVLMAAWLSVVRDLKRWHAALADSVDARHRAVRRSEERFRSLVQNSSDVITVVDVDGTIQYESPSVERVFGYGPETIMGTVLLDGVHPDDASLVGMALGQASREREGEVVFEARHRHRDGSWRLVETTAKSLLHDPSVGGLVLNSRDITERKTLEEELEHLAFHDSLTGLSNRALFGDRVEVALKRATRHDDKVAVLFLDLDNFKSVNDSLGHGSGDQLLVEVAHRLEQAVRPGDTTARLGGDEFAVLLDDLESQTDAVVVAERILSMLHAPFALENRDITVQASIGIALHDSARSAADAEELLRNADVAMYIAKGAGKDRYEVFEQQMHSAVLRRVGLEADLRRAIEHGDFVLHYQPTVVLDSGWIEGVEALVRWENQTLGLVPPAEFIGIAEDTGLIVQIGRWVLREACTQAQAWHQQFPDDEPLTMGVNLSVRQLLDPDLVSDVRTILEETGFDPRYLVLELTESALMADDQATMRTLTDLKQLGLQLAIDDFGTGYSSLSYLRRFPLDVLKIDKSFVDGLGSARPEATALTRAIIELARSLNLRTVAEGIELDGQITELQGLHCLLGQGFNYSRPVPSEELAGQLVAGGRNARLRAVANL